jgi:hypothetical protein
MFLFLGIQKSLKSHYENQGDLLKKKKKKKKKKKNREGSCSNRKLI